MQLGPFSLAALDGEQMVDGETVSGVQSEGTARSYELTGAGGLRLRIQEVRWLNGERDVVAAERYDSPETFDTLIGRLRLAVLMRAGGYYVELQQARRRGKRAQTFKADLAELDETAGVDCRGALIGAGATAVGTREALWGEDGRRRGFLVATFADQDAPVPVVAYVLTRVAPIAAGRTA
jgi:hypothetical protein